MQQLVYQTSSWPGWTEAVSYRCVAWRGTKHHRWRNNNWWVAQTSACVYSCQRRTFWAFALDQGHACDNFSVLSLWTLKENYYYCVKHVRFLPFLIFYISQGSVATRLRCGGKYNNVFTACKFLAEPSSERIFKIGQHFPKLCLRIGATPFLTHGVVISYWSVQLISRVDLIKILAWPSSWVCNVFAENGSIGCLL